MNAVLSSVKREAPLALIGGGRMGSAMLTGWLAGGLATDAALVIEPAEAAAAALRAAHPGVVVVESTTALESGSNVRYTKRWQCP